MDFRPFHLIAPAASLREAVALAALRCVCVQQRRLATDAEDLGRLDVLLGTVDNRLHQIARWRPRITP